jgi:biopolymer transport protein ExbD
MSMQVGGRSGSISTINVTPMADIMIVLLIIFMVATPFIGGLSKNLPSASHTRPRPDDPKTLVVVLSADGTAAMGAAQFPSPESLGPYLQLRLAALPKESRLVYVKADASLPQGAVQKVLELCREADAEEIALITSPRPR